MELMDSSKKIVQDHVKQELDSTSLEVMPYAVMALYATLGDIAKDGLPKILEELHIYAEEKTVLDMAHEYLNNYQEDDMLKHSDACVTRSLSFDEDDDSFIEEKRNLLISLLGDKDYFQIVSKIIHELIHLLRFGGVQQDGHKYKIKDGISVSYFDADTRKLRRKHQNMEEGIVQKYTNMAIRNLYELIKDEKIDSDVYRGFVEGFKTYTFPDYLLEVSMIEALCQNPRFEHLVEESFRETQVPSQAIVYYNGVMVSPSAFMELGKLIAQIRDNVLNDGDVMSDFIKAKAMVATFLNNSKYHK